MTTRFFVCIAISTCIHALVIIQPWDIVARGGNSDSPLLAVPVHLIEEATEEGILEDTLRGEEPLDEGVSFEAEGEVSADYMDQLKARIFNAWEYPHEAIEKEYEGMVKIFFVLDNYGSLTQIGILTSSGHYSLDTAAMGAIERAGPFGPFTEDVSAQVLKITGNFCYVLD
ncbi:MAG: energy transducer TonB [Deltaproteobacteria bacterium]|nr:energy transducer TonB [Deltaproteobacteria bacterium]